MNNIPVDIKESKGDIHMSHIDKGDQSEGKTRKIKTVQQ
jgi:hypothetical protein